MSEKYPFIRIDPVRFSEEETAERAQAFNEFMQRRRSIRDFSDRDIPFEVIENLVKTAGSAPSGANKQPWTFCIIRNEELKSKIRKAAEEEEFKSYNGRMSEEWLDDLRHLGTDWHKPFIETVPWIIVVFKRAFEYEGEHKHQNYYVNESVGLACGMLIAAIHNAGLATLTHTPSPMNFLAKILERPDNERPFLLLPVGYPAEDVSVPDIRRKEFNQISVRYD